MPGAVLGPPSVGLALEDVGESYPEDSLNDVARDLALGGVPGGMGGLPEPDASRCCGDWNCPDWYCPDWYCPDWHCPDRDWPLGLTAPGGAGRGGSTGAGEDWLLLRECRTIRAGDC